MSFQSMGQAFWVSGADAGVPAGWEAADAAGAESARRWPWRSTCRMSSTTDTGVCSPQSDAAAQDSVRTRLRRHERRHAQLVAEGLEAGGEPVAWTDSKSSWLAAAARWPIGPSAITSRKMKRMRSTSTRRPRDDLLEGRRAAPRHPRSRRSVARWPTERWCSASASSSDSLSPNALNSVPSATPAASASWRRRDRCTVLEHGRGHGLDDLGAAVVGRSVRGMVFTAMIAR